MSLKEPMSDQRLPDFLIIGAMKSGTTTLFRWLSTHGECQLPNVKELRFFCDDRKWEGGLKEYARFFEGVPVSVVTGEASPRYTHPDLSEKSASRIFLAIPRVRLIFIAREPLSRLRSHYRHEVQRGRERRPLISALQDPDNDYVRRSLYWTCLKPYLDRFPSEQIAIVRSDDLLVPPYTGWGNVLRHLGLSETEPSGEAFNVTAAKPQFSSAMLWLWERGVFNARHLLPRPLRRFAKTLLSSSSSSSTMELDVIPRAVEVRIREDLEKFQDALGRAPLWE